MKDLNKSLQWHFEDMCQDFGDGCEISHVEVSFENYSHLYMDYAYGYRAETDQVYTASIVGQKRQDEQEVFNALEASLPAAEKEAHAWFIGELQAFLRQPINLVDVVFQSVIDAIKGNYSQNTLNRLVLCSAKDIDMSSDDWELSGVYADMFNVDDDTDYFSVPCETSEGRLVDVSPY